MWFSDMLISGCVSAEQGGCPFRVVGVLGQGMPKIGSFGARAHSASVCLQALVETHIRSIICAFWLVTGADFYRDHLYLSEA